MGQKRYKPEQIIRMLREADVKLSQNQKVGQVCRGLGVTEQTYYRWRREYGGTKVSQARRLKDLERENSRLKREQICWSHLNKNLRWEKQRINTF